jgi:hypothetical protein
MKITQSQFSTDNLNDPPYGAGTEQDVQMLAHLRKKKPSELGAWENLKDYCYDEEKIDQQGRTIKI